MAKIFHYTTIEILALILKHHTIRFNKLDQVDDLEESIYTSGPINLNLSKYTYVSCWTKSEEENLALWKMYAGFKGIRIAMDDNMFVSYPYEHFQTFNSYFPKLFYFGEGFMADQMSNPVKLIDIQYTDSPVEKINNLLTQEADSISINTKDLGCFKRKAWAFQNESRFKIQVIPLNYKLIPKYTRDSLNSMDRLQLTQANFDITPAIIKSLQEGYVPRQSYIDVRLSTEAIQHLEIMMGPSTSEVDRFIVETLVEKLRYAKVENSFFEGIIKER